MKFALSTNWCNLRLVHGEDIVAQAERLGFDALELGFHTTAAQAAEIVACGRLPVGSIHAFCPVPMSAPQGYPELYPLASFDEAASALARVHVRRNIVFAASIGARTVVLHAGRVGCRGFFKSHDLRRRVKRGARLLPLFQRELEQLLPDLERHQVTLGLENLPYLEGFPGEWELARVVGDWVKPWFDTGHDFVRETNGWPCRARLPEGLAACSVAPVGLHVHDSVGGDDHLPPGEGKIDFAALRPLAETAQHVVLEPHANVSEEALARGLAYVKGLWTR